MKRLFLCLASLIPLCLLAQEINLVQKSDTTFANPDKSFLYLSPQADLSEMYHVASCRLTRKKLVRNFYTVEKKAVKLGANAFRVRTNDQSSEFLLFDVYHISDSVFAKYEIIKEKNTVYIFPNKLKKTSFKFNGIKIKLAPNEFFKVQLKKREKIELNKGGYLGTSLWFLWEENQKAIFLGLQGINGVSGSGIGGYSIGISPGRITGLPKNLAHLLIELGVEKTMNDY